MKVLVIGSGGREHALLWALKKSPILTELYVTPGRQAMENLGVLVDVNIQNSVDVTQ
ncbi:MAG: phosphoribosylamine--glycine ligase N-terminal domain-containing protein, partial [Wolbachia pipientis]